MSGPDAAPSVAAAGFFSIGRFPPHVGDYAISTFGKRQEESLDGPSDSRVILVTVPSGELLVLKTVPDDDPIAYHALIASLMSLRFYFLAPVQGFTTLKPYGFFYSYYDGWPTLQSVLVSKGPVPKTVLSLIAALVCYALAYLEANQVIHGALHSGNIFLTPKFTPVITDYGLPRTYDFFTSKCSAGRLSWVAPELLLSSHPNYNADMFSFGALLFEFFEHRRPFVGLTNFELLVGYRAGKLRSFDYDATPPEWRILIGKCTDPDPDLRPSFAELYHLFQRGTLVFPGSETDEVKHILSKYTIDKIFGLCEPEQPNEMAALVAFLADPQHPQFKEAAFKIAATVTTQDADVFCEALAIHIPSATVHLILLLMDVLHFVCERGPELRKCVLGSKLFKYREICDDRLAGLLLKIFTPIFTDFLDMFAPPTYQAVGAIVVHRPAAMLRLLSRYFKATAANRPAAFQDNIGFYLGLWSLFQQSSLGDRYLHVLGFLLSECPDIKPQHGRELLAIALQYFESASPPCLREASLFLARFCSDALVLSPESALLLAKDDEHADECKTIFLHARSIDPSLSVFRIIVSWARFSRRPLEWAVLTKYLLQSDTHAALAVAVGTWCDADLPDAELPLRVLLALFQCPSLREPLSRMKEFPSFLAGLGSLHRPEYLYVICTLIQSVPLDPAYAKRLSEAGFLSIYFRETLDAADAAIVKLGICVADAIARVTYCDEFVRVVNIFIEFLTSRVAELGDELIKVLSCLSSFPQCMAPMKREGLQEYYQGLLEYEQYAEFANFFLANAASM
jgi:hypothetical protein